MIRKRGILECLLFGTLKSRFYKIPTLRSLSVCKNPVGLHLASGWFLLKPATIARPKPILALPTILLSFLADEK
jgi:hypothetical protein